jgi:hypothetical protein
MRSIVQDGIEEAVCLDGYEGLGTHDRNEFDRCVH